MERSLQYLAVPEHITRDHVKIHVYLVQLDISARMLRTNTLHAQMGTSALTVVAMQSPVQ